MSVDQYIAEHGPWQPVLGKLRAILLETELEETIKWGAPSYGFGTKNVVGLAAFEQHVALWFHQGALLDDPDQVLERAQESTKAMRHMRFRSPKDIVVKRVRDYVQRAVENQRAGLAIAVERKRDVVVPPELALALDANAAAKLAFASLSPGKQREYADYIASAKRDATKRARIDKILPMIEAGAGLHDKYRGC